MANLQEKYSCILNLETTSCAFDADKIGEYFKSMIPGFSVNDHKLKTKPSHLMESIISSVELKPDQTKECSHNLEKCDKILTENQLQGIAIEGTSRDQSEIEVNDQPKACQNEDHSIEHVKIIETASDVVPIDDAIIANEIKGINSNTNDDQISIQSLETRSVDEELNLNNSLEKEQNVELCIDTIMESVLDSGNTILT